jgi:putative ABC transport system substrate-binding protein
MKHTDAPAHATQMRFSHITAGDGWWRICLIACLLLSHGLFHGYAGAAERNRPILIGALTNSWGHTPQMVALWRALQELGYRKNEDFVVGVRFTQGDLTALPAAARELVQYGVDIIIAGQRAEVKAAQLATAKIPIVFTNVTDPLGAGLVKSFARPGGNTTGVTELTHDLSPKRLEVFLEIVPNLKRILYLYDPKDAASVARARVYRDTAHRLGIELVEQTVRSEAAAQATLAQIRKGEVDGVLPPTGSSLNLRDFLLEFAAKLGLPTMFNTAFWAERGALASYGPDYYASGRQAARLVDKILKGVNPGDIPVEVNSKIEFTINLKTAKALGLTIPPEVLFRADRIIR